MFDDEELFTHKRKLFSDEDITSRGYPSQLPLGALLLLAQSRYGPKHQFEQRDLQRSYMMDASTRTPRIKMHGIGCTHQNGQQDETGSWNAPHSPRQGGVERGRVARPSYGRAKRRDPRRPQSRHYQGRGITLAVPGTGTQRCHQLPQLSLPCPIQ